MWGLGAPETELWMDNWCIVKAAAENVERGLRVDQLHPRPEISLKDLEFHGYNTGINGVQEQAEAADLEYLDMVFFSDEDVPRWTPAP